MIFTTYWFLAFIGLALPLYWLVRRPGLRLAVLLVACTVFHARFAGAAGMLPILVLCATTYLAGLSRRRGVLLVGMALPILALVFYKYTSFLSQQVLAALNPAWGAALEQALGSRLPDTPPLGVSFFVFEFVHYLYDVWHGHPSIRHPARFWAFTFFFPSLVAGPIKRYRDFLPALSAGLQQVTLDDLKYGLWRIAQGYVKKVVLADNLTGAIDYWYPHFTELTLPQRWLFLAALSFRILFDFSGYSDIAIGLARLMGIRLPENFRWPYLARNLREFWQRWHISLSSWIRDYIYIPLGGSRHGVFRRSINVIIALALCGLWHGPAWNFVLWGVWHGVGLQVCTFYPTALGPVGGALQRGFARLPILAWAVTFVFVALSRLIFFYPVPECFRLMRLLVVAQ
ncbi:MBOAT family O-acyltransferase [Opitutus sp. ER46]|uniref:MBOAT family O-acyltransferase n=1 Tax=Opitutus sp. ER46 TaxID=2161864 RepID=UPI000D320923|nr:MBOAT family O-acyltransferase [Opitutus sp. ER46]PTX98391.1 MBOAT family protein [Opitutus sp. ER46]